MALDSILDYERISLDKHRGILEVDRTFTYPAGYSFFNVRPLALLQTRAQKTLIPRLSATRRERVVTVPQRSRFGILHKAVVFSMKDFFTPFIRNKRHLATVAFAVGFLVDIVTFRTLNLEVAQIILAGYLVILAGSIIILAIPQRLPTSGILKFIHAWLPVVQQYAAGNLLSAFLVLYFSSGSLSASWPFLALVLLAVVGNETFSIDKYRIPFQTTVFCLVLVLFSALATPVAFGVLGFFTFLWSLGFSLGAFVIFFIAASLVAPDSFLKHAGRITAGAAAVAVLVLVLYVTNLIPPIPLSAKNVDFYHSVEKVGDVYVAEDESRSWFERFVDMNGVTLHIAPGASAYVYTSIFAPAHFGADIVHRWEWFDPLSNTWVTKNRVGFPILGGRSEGYRGYSLIEDPVAGRWRVSVETNEGAVIGRALLMVKPVSVPIVTTERTLY